MKFVRLYEYHGKPFPSADKGGSDYHVGLGHDEGVYVVWLDGAEPQRMRSYSRDLCEALVRRGEWTLYTPPTETKEHNLNLNIDYASIIAMADKRRATLQELQEEMQMLTQMTQQLREALGYFEHLRLLHSALDSEGKSIAGAAMEHLAIFVSQTSSLMELVKPQSQCYYSLPVIFSKLGLEMPE